MSAVLFDLFETLVTEWGRPKYTTREIAADLEVDATDFRREWKTLHGDRYLGKKSGTMEVCEHILNKLGVVRDEHLLRAISEKRDACKRQCFAVIEPEILRMLSSLKASGYQIGLISNCSAEEIVGLRDSALYGCFDAIVLSCEAGFVKPDARIYERCLSVIGENPSDCFFVGDGGSDELNGAYEVGLTPLRALWFIKHFVKDYEAETKYPAFREPYELTGFLCK